MTEKLAAEAAQALQGVTDPEAAASIEEARRESQNLSYHPKVRKLFECMAEMIAAITALSAKAAALKAQVAELTRERDEAHRLLANADRRAALTEGTPE